MRWRIQFNRYAIMGIACDTTDYLLYLLFAYLGTSYKTAMRLLCILGAICLKSEEFEGNINKKGEKT